MTNFPGNPYDGGRFENSSDSAAIEEAIKLLAFEVRTLNLLIAKKPIVMNDPPSPIAEYVAKLGGLVEDRLGNPTS